MEGVCFTKNQWQRLGVGLGYSTNLLRWLLNCYCWTPHAISVKEIVLYDCHLFHFELNVSFRSLSWVPVTHVFLPSTLHTHWLFSELMQTRRCTQFHGDFTVRRELLSRLTLKTGFFILCFGLLTSAKYTAGFHDCMFLSLKRILFVFKCIHFTVVTLLLTLKK